MRKKVMSTSKRKWIVSGLLGFGAVALLTTGFATWVVGVNKSNTTIDPSTSVNGTVNQMVSLTVEFQTGDDNKVSVSEKVASEEGKFISNPDGEPTDFTVSPHIKIEVGKSLKQLPSGIEFKLGYKELMDATFKTETHVATTVDKNKVTFENDTKTHAKAVEYEYFKIDADANITLPLLSSSIDWTGAAGTDGVVKTYTGSGNANGWTVTETGNSYTYTSNNAIKLFDWGSFFDNKSPVKFYDGLYQAKKIQNTADDIDFVVNEMTEMQHLFDGEKLNVICNLTLQENK